MKTPEQEPLTEWLVCPKCSYKSPYSPIKAKTLAEDAERITKQTRAALAQQEPVARYSDIVSNGGLDPRNTVPQKREWVGLTVEQIEDVGFNLLPTVAQKDFVAFARDVEARLKEKNT